MPLRNLLRHSRAPLGFLGPYGRPCWGSVGLSWGLCLFGSAYVAERCGQSSATLSDCVFPEPLWEPFGEHGEEEEEAEAEEEEEEEE